MCPFCLAGAAWVTAAAVASGTLATGGVALIVQRLRKPHACEHVEELGEEQGETNDKQ
jgi:hypothetical protein